MRVQLLGRSIWPTSLVGVMLLMLAPSLPAAEPKLQKLATVEGITEYRLPNGLRVLLFPDASKPLVTVNLTVFCGSRHEGYGETGMAHLLEHLLFKGTPTHPDVPKALRDHGAGGRFNGTTWVDRTNYYETMPANEENLEFGIRLEADRMVNSFVRREDLASEMTVVRNEFESGENSPERVLSQRMMAVAYEWHNYGKSTIGNRSDIERVPIDNLKAFYKKFYRPDNAMLVVAGQFNQAKAMQFIEQYFGVLKNPETPLPNTYTQEPAQDGERIVNLRRVGTVGAVGAVYHIPSGAHPDYPALQILEDILTSQPNGRLYKALVASKKASSLSGSAFAWHDPGVIEITASTDAKQLDDVRDTMIRTLEELAASPITEDEIARSKQRFRTLIENLTANTSSMAVQLSEWAACGDWRLFFLHRDRVEKVTAADVNRVAAEYLTRSNRTVGQFIPTEKPARAAIPETPSVAELVEGYKGRTDVVAGEAFSPTPENVQKRLVQGKLSPSFEYGLLSKKTRGEVVNLTMVLKFGNEQSLAGKTNAADFIGSMLRRGTAKYNRQQLSDELDKLGARVGLRSGAGELGVTIQAKRETLLPTLALVEEMLRHPTFPAEEFEILQREQREAIEKQRTEPQALASNLLRRTLQPYPPSDVRYSPTIEEQLEQLNKLTVEDVRKLYAEQVGGEIGQLAIVGDFDTEPALEAIKKILADWKTEVPYKRIERTAQFLKQGEIKVIETPDKANAVYLAGQIYGLKDSDPDYAALQVGNFLLGEAPLSSRLSNRVRGKEGLSYGVGSQTRAGSKDALGQFIIFAITNPGNIDKVDAAVRDELKKFYEQGVSLGELNEGKTALLNRFNTERTNDGELARQILSNLDLGRTFLQQAELEQRIANVTPEQIQAAFRKHLPLEKRLTVEAGDFKKMP
ncbi:M16 family metallopeptidase [Tuwongella immobilis]|uniref:Peptidase M16 C-terminal domain-containing protein n=1 Tax=Tuwongella immobilis TaxID=692036 RepID=A0A6C2YRY6_9BACT|nr:pitrilysin family protein [Tuwongella immobilis]VIP04430.1 m16b family peptidase : Pseudouridine synthase OS=Cystobacter violaceus Cb vi76 GN=Q664_26185 PE=3 SV=1: Peptidase_M16: Peptidase_M16_C: Peptidase_M16: Peptidase_M16_C [Tuwongella immobilis]VTS06222.1 m16b family peptidase : Pseudouridine synthase OS=Cystobacter violaceus Cb vi76 GN=Q664_26185 PE=3 SV=1: Peptidase_M16: Peptidase_M16_C: Peptidase_M16: Peptidase_M16_C [Tuwongella immobilis]